jgi:RND superfamily putative drug exporter
MRAVFDRLARAVARHPWSTALAWLGLIAAAVALALVGVTGTGLFDRLESGAPRVPGSESLAGTEILQEDAGRGERITLVLREVDLRDPGTAQAVATALAPAHVELAAIPGVASVVDPFLLPGGLANPVSAAFVSREQDGFLVVVNLEPGLDATAEEEAADAVVERLEEVPAELADAAPDATGIVTSGALVTEAVIGQVEKDLKTGELIALPISLLIMVVVFGGFLAAGLPVVGAIASIAGGLGALLAFTYVMTIDSVVVNVVTVLGLGLSIDYGLLIVSRYREELRSALDAVERRPRVRARRRDLVVEVALRRTLTTAGRTVVFSALTVAIAISGLLVMRPDILRSLGAAGVSVVLIAVLTAVTLVPALLALLGRRMLRPPALARVPGLRRLLRRLGDVAPEEGVFSALAARVQRHPWWVLLGVVAVLGVLAAPALHLDLRNSTVELIPSDSDQREVVDVFAADYPAAATPPILLVAEASTAQADAWAQEIAQIPGVASVDPAEQVGSSPYVTLGVRLETDDAGGEEASEVVGDIRAGVPGFPFWVTGQAANQIDFVEALLEGLPAAAAIVVTATLVLLFLMTGSLLVPLKALVINVVSLTASLGVTVWIFQDGHLEGVLDFTSPGGLESYVVAVALAFGFGLAMDYEVFLLSRIKELYDAGLGNDEAVRLGLQRSGRIITSAALIIIVVFAGFVAGDLLVIKEVGVALAVTVLVDATLVRMLLVPATMTLLGEWNWWAPAALRRVHERLAIRH